MKKTNKTKKSKSKLKSSFIKKILSGPLPFIAVFCILGLATLGASFAARNNGGGSTVLFDKAAAQPNEHGKQIAALASYNGKIYAGYGDWAANTGPIMIQSYDPATNLVKDEFLARAHALHKIDVHSNGLFFPITDGAMDFVTYRNGTWAESKPLDGDHYFQSVEFNDRIWVAGQMQNKATVISSGDGGVSWRTDLVDPAGGVRYHSIAVHNNKLYVQSSIAPNAWTYDPLDGQWRPTNQFILDSWYEAWKLQTFAGKLVYLSKLPVYSNSPDSIGAALISHDTENNINKRHFQAVDFTVKGNVLYVLNSGGNISKTTDLVNWTVIGKAPTSRANRRITTGRSLAVLGSDIYVGTSDSKLIKLVGIAAN